MRSKATRTGFVSTQVEWRQLKKRHIKRPLPTPYDLDPGLVLIVGVRDRLPEAVRDR
jgi:hypothetical protein